MAGPDGKPLALYDNIFPATPSGKIELKSAALAERWGAAAVLPALRQREGAVQRAGPVVLRMGRVPR